MVSRSGFAIPISRAEIVRAQVEANLAKKIPSALTVRERPKIELFSTGIGEVDAAIARETGAESGGLPRGALSEICGPASSGRTSILLSLLAQVSGQSHPEFCAVVDASDAFHPASAEKAGVELSRLLWVRCGSSSGLRAAALSALEKALKVTDLLLQSGGFGLVVVDLGDLSPQIARRVPLTSWFRFSRTVENTPTALVVLEEEPYAKTCASLVLQVKAAQARWANLFSPEFFAAAGSSNCAAPTHTNLLRGLDIHVEVARARKQPQSVVSFGRKATSAASSAFETQMPWAG
ncbi:MAG: RecA domain protein [Acidobacteriales bacterium]|nr:RecA domain protein [Terriglobales bacterium]